MTLQPGLQRRDETGAPPIVESKATRRFDVLSALERLGGRATVGDLVRARGGDPAIARTVISRGLRRLWRRGCVELYGRHGMTASAWTARGVRRFYIRAVSVNAFTVK